MLHENHSLFGEGQARYQGNDIGEKSDRLGSKTVTGQGPECYLTFVRGRLQVELDPRIDHKTV